MNSQRMWVPRTLDTNKLRLAEHSRLRTTSAPGIPHGQPSAEFEGGGAEAMWCACSPMPYTPGRSFHGLFPPYFTYVLGSRFAFASATERAIISRR